MLKRSLIIFSALLFVGWSASCSRKTAPAAKAEYDGPKVSYSANIAPLVERSCSPCHYPEKGGNKAALDSYEGLKAEFREVIKRVQLPEDDANFMPFKHKREALTAEEVELLKNWSKGGFPE